MTENEQGELDLPGLDLGPTPKPGSTSLRDAVAATIRALHNDGLLQPRHVGLCQLALTLADSVQQASRGTKAYAIAQSAAQLRETLAALPEPASGGGQAQFAAFLIALKEAGANGAPSA